MSISTEQLRDIVDGEDRSTILHHANTLRSLAPDLMMEIGRRAVEEEAIDGLAERVRTLNSAADMLERLHGYAGALDQ